MSDQSQVLNTGQQAIINTDLSKIFILNNRYKKDVYVNNSTYDPITLLAGTVMGRVTATNIFVPFRAAASDGSQYPVGVLAQDIILAGGATENATICTFGDVAQEKLLFQTSGDGIHSIAASRRVEDWLRAQGINPVVGTEMTGYDNQ